MTRTNFQLTSTQQLTDLANRDTTKPRSLPSQKEEQGRLTRARYHPGIRERTTTHTSRVIQSRYLHTIGGACVICDEKKFSPKSWEPIVFLAAVTSPRWATRFLLTRAALLYKGIERFLTAQVIVGSAVLQEKGKLPCRKPGSNVGL